MTAPDDPTATSAAGWQVMQTKAANALAANQAFLALTNPTAADIAGQVRALTRQQNVLIRMLVQSTFDTS